jgi:nicotinamidase-related amidase
MMMRVKAATLMIAAFSLMLLAGCESENRARESRGNEPALVLIDLQQSFLSSEGSRPVAEDQAETLIKAVNAMIDAAHKQVVPVIYVKDEYSRFQFAANMARDDAALRYEAGSSFDPRVNDVGGVYFAKTCEDGFSNDAFQSHLKTIGAGRLIIAGVRADGSVLATAKTAIARGYGVTVISDAVAADTDNDRDTALKQLKDAGAGVETSADFIASIANADKNASGT